MKQWQRASIAVILFGVFALLAQRSCGGSNQYEQLGQALGQRAEQGGQTVAGFAYVGDMRKALYWPNEEPYISAIPKADRVWIKDEETLRQFKGYRAGPR